jgi:hypothetical protein
MSVRNRRFETGIDSVWGRWPDTPEHWSYSSLKDIAACPRRWMLTRSAYPEVWSRNGYPTAPILSAIFGDVVHLAIESVTRALIAGGSPPADSAEAVAVLRELGGYTAVIHEAVATRLGRLEGNPRLSEARLEAYRRSLTDRMQEARIQVQTRISRIQLPGNPPYGGRGAARRDSSGSEYRQPIGAGAHPEVQLVAEELRLRGQIDLLAVDANSVEITDFKTGDEDSAHLQQLNTYALLWDLDRQRPGEWWTSDLALVHALRSTSHVER